MRTLKLTNTFIIFLLALIISCEETPNKVVLNDNENFEVSHAVAKEKTLWQKEKRDFHQTVTLNVLILNGSRENQDLIKETAQEWGKYGNIDFVFSTYPAAKEVFDIMIEIYEEKNELGYAGTSATGNEAKYFIDNLDPSMRLWFTESDSLESKKGTILHEFGHALGLQHEHKHPQRSFNYNEKEVYVTCSNLGWTKKMCDDFKVNTYPTEGHVIFNYDLNSIMHYLVHKSELSNNDKSIGGSRVLSTLDKIAIAKLYPGRMNEAEIQDKAHEIEKEELKLKQLAEDIFDFGEVKNCKIIIVRSSNDPLYSYISKEPNLEAHVVLKPYRDKQKIVNAMMVDPVCEL